MITLFTTPKAFRGRIGVIQWNALRSWRHLGPDVDILVFGDGAGAAEAARELGLRHIPAVRATEAGTPLVDGLFEAAQAMSRFPLLAYVNADIVLMEDFRAALRLVAGWGRFLMIGQRWDLRQEAPPVADGPDWQATLQRLVTAEGSLHAVTGLDYFVFPRGLWPAIPPFAIGRSAWDNWLVYGARARGAPVIDATAMVMAVHQAHDYAHVPDGAEAVWNGPEAQRNQALLGGDRHFFTVEDATHALTPAGPRRVLTRARLRRHLDTFPVLHPRLGRYLPAVRRALRPLGRLWA